MERLLIADVTLVTPNAAPRRVDVLITAGRFESIAPGGSLAVDAATIDGSGFVALPGLVNAHTHSHNALSKGLGDVWSLELLLNYGPALNARRTPEDHYWAALLNGLEMLATGATAAYDLVIHAPAPSVESISAVVRAYQDLGMRAIVAPAIADRPVYAIIPGLLDALPGDLRREAEALLPVPGEALLALLERILREVQTTDRVRLGVAPTIPAQCTDALLLGCDKLAREFDVGLHTHLAESRVQAIEGVRRYGTTLTRHLARLGILGPHVVAAHAVWLDADDTRLLADSGVRVAHNPGSNLKLGSGIAPVREYVDAGVPVAIGTDGSASSDNQNIIEAMRLASLVSRIRAVDPARWLDARTTLGCAIHGGAAACAGLAISGRVEPGEPADLTLLRRDSVFLQPANDLLTQLVHSETAAAVDTVIVAGEVVLRGGKSTRVDADTVRRNAQAAIERVMAHNAAEWELARRLTPYIVQTCSQLAAMPYPVDRLLLEQRS